MQLDTNSIKKSWIKNFGKCKLVDENDWLLNADIAYQLYYGKRDDSYPAEYHDNFNSFYLSYRKADRETTINNLLKYLHFIGVVISKTAIDKHLKQYPDELEKILKKAIK